MDDGRSVPVPYGQVHLMAPEFGLDKTPPLVFRCHLFDVVSCHDLPNLWPGHVTDFVAKETRTVPQLWIQKRGDCELMSDGYVSLPVELHFKEEVVEMFAKCYEVMVAMSTKLLRRNYAVPRLQAAEIFTEEERESESNKGAFAIGHINSNSLFIHDTCKQAPKRKI